MVSTSTELPHRLLRLGNTHRAIGQYWWAALAAERPAQNSLNYLYHYFVQSPKYWFEQKLRKYILRLSLASSGSDTMEMYFNVFRPCSFGQYSPSIVCMFWVFSSFGVTHLTCALITETKQNGRVDNCDHHLKTRTVLVLDRAMRRRRRNGW